MRIELPVITEKNSRPNRESFKQNLVPIVDLKRSPSPPVPTKPLGPPPESPRLRVHVKALPGTAVHIHHGTETPPQSSRKQHNQSTASVETDI